MNSLGLNLILRMGCLCTREKVQINGKTYSVISRLGEGYVVSPFFHSFLSYLVDINYNKNFMFSLVEVLA